MSPPPLHRDPSLIPLSHQHQHGLALALAIERGLRDDPTGRMADELGERVARMAEGELLGHFRVEEADLFPAVRPFLRSGALIDRLVAEHRLMEDLMKRIGAASGSDRIPILREFAEVLRRHIRTEERELFPEIQERLDPDRLADTGRRIAADLRTACPLAGDRT